MKDNNIIKGQRLDLVPFSEEHISDKYISWLNDKDLMQYSRQRFMTHDYESCLNFLNSYKNSKSYFWAVISHEHGHVGNITADTNEIYRLAKLSIMLGERSVQGQGYGLAAWSQAMTYLLTQANYRKVSGGTMEINIPMLTIFKRSGMTEECRLIRRDLYQDREIDCIVYCKFYDDPSLISS